MSILYASAWTQVPNFTGESGLVYKGYINTAVGTDIVAVKTGKGMTMISVLLLNKMHNNIALLITLLLHQSQ